jgi:phenylpropionate dioxygenase-like ring-hydroxylating dioxygenase large terminal subunit
VVFPGTLSCPYHGWTFDTKNGRLCAAITDGPDSPIVGKVTVRSYPVESRHGLVWIFIGDDPDQPAEEVPPLETDLPAELHDREVTAVGRIEPGRGGNWRYATENGFDEGHAKYQHRTALWTLFRQLPVWNETKVMRTDDERWVIRRQLNSHWEADFPGLGPWSQRRWWKFKRTSHGPSNEKGAEPVLNSLRLPAKASVGLPGVVRIAYAQYVHYEWAVAETAGTHRYVQLLVSFAKPWRARLWFTLKYYAYIRWVFHGAFTGQDAWMVDVMAVPPERLYRPDSSVLEWRKLVEDKQAPPARAVPDADL